MDKRDDNDIDIAAAAPQRPRLTIVRSPDAAKPAKPKLSPFVAFMTAYADAIDAEVKAIMDL